MVVALDLNLQVLQISTQMCGALINKVHSTEWDNWKREIEARNQIRCFFFPINAKRESILARTVCNESLLTIFQITKITFPHSLTTLVCSVTSTEVHWNIAFKCSHSIYWPQTGLTPQLWHVCLLWFYLVYLPCQQAVTAQNQARGSAELNSTSKVLPVSY